MSEFSVEGPELKKMIKFARKGPISFGFNPGKSAADAVVSMHRKKPPKILGKAAKEEGDGTKFSFGTCVVEGKVLKLMCERELPAMAKKMKIFLKSQKVMLNVEIYDASGNLMESDVEDNLPDDPELDGDVDDDGDEDDNGTDQAAAPPPAPAAPPPPADAALGDLTKRLGAIAARIKALPPEHAARITGPFQQVVGLARAGNADAGNAAAAKIEAALDMLEKSAAPKAAAPAPPPPPDPQMAKLMQMVDAMRGKGDMITDTDRRLAFDKALDRAGQLVQAKETEQAVTILKKLQELLKQVAAGAVAPPPPTAATETVEKTVAPPPEAGTPQPAPEQTAREDGASSPQETEWLQAFGELEPGVNEALTQGLVADAEALRKAWQWAVTNAADGAFDVALAQLPRIRELFGNKAADGQSSFAAEIGDAAKPIAAARINWINTRAQMQSQIKRLEEAIMTLLSDDEDAMEAMGSEIAGLTGRLNFIEDTLQDTLDDIVNSKPEDDAARAKLKGEAKILVDQYSAEFETPFFQDIDQNNGFLTVSVAGPAKAALAAISNALK